MNIPISISQFFGMLPTRAFPSRLPPYLGRLFTSLSYFPDLFHDFIDTPLPPSYIYEQDNIIQCSGAVDINESEFGREDSFFDIISHPANELRPNELIIAVLMHSIDSNLIQFIESIEINKYSEICIIRLNSFGTFQTPFLCDDCDIMHNIETVLDTIAIRFCSVGIFKCISLHYTDIQHLNINAETLNPDHSILDFYDYKSVIMALNKIIRVKILQPIIDKRMPLLLYSRAIKNKNKNVIQFTLCTFRIAHIESFL